MRRRFLAWGLLALAALLAAGCGAATRASAKSFAGHWWGHTRGLDIDRSGHGREYEHVVGFARPLTIRFRIVRVYGKAGDAIAHVRVTSVDGPHGILKLAHRPNLRADDAGTLLLRHGVISNSLTSDDFCAPHVAKCGL